jgi:hypothetical protein
MRFLRWNLQDGKCILLSWRLASNLLCNLLPNRWHITWDTQPGMKVLRLECHCYNKSCLGPTLSTSPRYDDRKPFLVVSDPCLTFLSSACTSFTPNQVYSLVRVYHQAISWWFWKRLPFYLISTRVSLLSSKYPTGCRSTFEPCCYDLTRDFMYPSCSIYPGECHLYSCQSSFRSWSLTPMKAVSIDMKLDKGLLNPKHSMKLSEKGIGWLMQHDRSCQSTLLPTHRRKSMHERSRSPPPSNCYDILLSQRARHPSSFLVLSLLS